MKRILTLLVFLCAIVLAQTPKKIVAVYMAGKEPAAVKGSHKVLGAELSKSLTKSDKYTAVDRTEEGRKIVSQEHILQRSGAVDREQVKKLGKQLSADIVCIAEVADIMNSHYFEARFVDVETAEVLNIAYKIGNLAKASDIEHVAQAIAYELVNGEPKSVYYSIKQIEFNPNKAIEDYTQAIRLNPNAVEYYNKRGVAYIFKKDYDRAISDYTQAIRLNPDYGDAYHYRGFAYFNKGDHDQAISDYTQTIRLNPDDAVAYYNRGVSYGEKGSYDQAISDFTQAIRLNGNIAEAYYNRGVMYDAKEDYDQALSDYTHTIRLDPDFYRAYCNRGIVYHRKENYDRAMSDYTETIRLNPNIAVAYYNRGLVHYEKENYDKAMSDWKSALRIDPDYSDARDNLETLMEEMGK